MCGCLLNGSRGQIRTASLPESSVQADLSFINSNGFTFSDAQTVIPKLGTSLKRELMELFLCV